MYAPTLFSFNKARNCESLASIASSLTTFAKRGIDECCFGSLATCFRLFFTVVCMEVDCCEKVQPCGCLWRDVGPPVKRNWTDSNLKGWLSSCLVQFFRSLVWNVFLLLVSWLFRDLDCVWIVSTLNLFKFVCFCWDNRVCCTEPEALTPTASYQLHLTVKLTVSPSNNFHHIKRCWLVFQNHKIQPAWGLH